MPEKESKSLNNSHNRERNSDRSRRLCVNLPHKISISHDIKRSNQHADDGRHSQ